MNNSNFSYLIRISIFHTRRCADRRREFEGPSSETLTTEEKTMEDAFAANGISASRYDLCNLLISIASLNHSEN